MNKRLALVHAVLVAMVLLAVSAAPTLAARVTRHVSFLSPDMGMSALVDPALGQVDTQYRRIVTVSPSGYSVFAGTRSITRFHSADGAFSTLELDRPGGLAVDEGAGHLFVTLPDRGTTRLYQVDPLLPLADLPTGARPERIARNPDSGMLFIFDAAAGEIVFVHGGSFKVLGSAALPAADVVDMVVHRGSRRLFVLRRGDAASSHVTVIDETSRAVIDDVAFPPDNTMLAASEVLGRVYLAGSHDQVYRFDAQDPASQATINGLTGGHRVMVVNEDRSRIYLGGGMLPYTGSNPSDLLVIDGTTELPVSYDYGQGEIVDLAVDAAGGRVFAAFSTDFGAGVLLVLDALTGFQEITRVDAGSDPGQIAFDAAARRLLAVCPQTALIVSVDAADPAYGFFRTAVGVRLANPQYNDAVTPPKLYVQNAGLPGVSTINGLTESRGPDVVTGQGPVLGATLGATGEFYEVCLADREITVIDGWNDQLRPVDLGRVGDVPYAVAIYDVAPTPLVFLANIFGPAARAFQVIDMQWPALLNVPLPAGMILPSAVAVNAASATAYVAVLDIGAPFFPHRIAVYDIGTGAFRPAIDIEEAAPPNPFGASLAVHQGLNRVFADDRDGEIAVIDGAANQVLTTLALPGVPLDIVVDEAGGIAYALVEDPPSLERIDVQTASLLSPVPLPSRPAQMTLDAARGKILVALGGQDEITVVDAATASIEARLTDINPLVDRRMMADRFLIDNRHGAMAVVDAAGLPSDDLQILDPGPAVFNLWSDVQLQLTATGGSAPYRWGIVSGVPPPGMALQPDGLFDWPGASTAPGAWTFTVACADVGGLSDIEDVTVVVLDLHLITTALPDGDVAAPYEEFLKAVGGTPPYTFAIVSGQLPSGVALADATAGRIAGTPDTVESAVFEVTVTDSGAPVQTARRTLSITIAGPPALDSVDPPQAEAGLSLTVALRGSGFRYGSIAVFGGTGITVTRTRFLSASELAADLQIDPLAAAGARDVTVVNPNLQASTLPGAFNVLDASPPADVGNSLYATRTGAPDEVSLVWGPDLVDADWSGSNLYGSVVASDVAAGRDAPALEPFRLGAGSPPALPDVAAPVVTFVFTASEPLLFMTVRYLDRAGNLSTN